MARGKWEQLLFDAAVVYVHAPGKVDVVYDVDGSVGTLRTYLHCGTHCSISDDVSPRKGGVCAVLAAVGVP